MTLREKIARGLSAAHWQKFRAAPGYFEREFVENGWEGHLHAADAVLALLSDPANISDEMREIAVGVYEDQPRLSDMRVMARAIAAAFTAAKGSET